MRKTLEFPDLLRLIDERATAFRAALAAAPSLGLPVPTCPGWTLFDLVQHIGEGRRRWAATVAAGPDATSRTPAQGDAVAPQEPEAVPAWLAASTELLLAALREAGPDQGCFTGWGNTQTPHTAGGVARHQVQEIAVHTYESGSVKLAWALGLGRALAAACSPASATARSSPVPARSWRRRSLSSA